MIRLPLESAAWPQMRIVTAASFAAQDGSPDTSSAAWSIEPMWRAGIAGYEVLSCERVALPQIGTAVMRYRVGVIDERLVGELSDGSNPSAWDPATMTSTPPSLIGKEVRIQQRDEDSGGWWTIFWGQVEYEEDHGWSASVLPAGERLYHLTDALGRCRKWRFSQHAYSGGTGTASLRPGAVGYNVQDGDVVRGNRGTTNVLARGVQIREHTLPGGGGTWTDEDIIEHALAITRPRGEPSWVVPSDQAVGYLNGGPASSIPVDRDTTALDVLLRAADWKRGRGVVFLAWEEAASTDDAVMPLRTYLACSPPFLADYSRDVTAFGGSTISWAGATSHGTAIEVDLVGDHRAIADALKLGDAAQYRVEYLETYGDPIEVVTTLSVLDGSLEKRWTPADETALAALTDAKRSSERWAPVGQMFGVPVSWDGRAANGNGGSRAQVLVRCRDDGSLDRASSGFSPLSIRVLPDLPIFDGYTYAGSSPAKASGSSTISEDSTPSRKAAMGLVRVASDRYLPTEDDGVGLTLRINQSGIWLRSPLNEQNGTRYFADAAGLSPDFAPTAAAVTVALAGEPVRMARAVVGKDADNARTRKSMRISGVALHLADAGAIYELDGENESGGGFPAKRAACASGNGILRDDRLALAFAHEMAARWYGLPGAAGEPAEPRRSASWSLRCGGMAGSFPVISESGESAGSISYPAIGELVSTLYANGSRYELNTPITRIHYDHQQGTTTWSTDWQELDFQ